MEANICRPVRCAMCDCAMCSSSVVVFRQDHNTLHRTGPHSLFNFGRAVHEIVLPELVHRILDQLDERDQQAPRMRPVDDQALQQDARDLLLPNKTHTWWTLAAGQFGVVEVKLT